MWFCIVDCFTVCITAAVPVHVDASPSLCQDAEQSFISELTRGKGIVDRLKKKSSTVIRLMRQLGKIRSRSERTVIDDQLEKEFEAGLHEGGVLPRLVPVLAQLMANTTVRDIHLVLSKRGHSIVVYFLCSTVQSLYDLGQLIVSGFMHAVFAVVIESLACSTSVDVYVPADEFNIRMLCLSSPQDKGLSRENYWKTC